MFVNYSKWRLKTSAIPTICSYDGKITTFLSFSFVSVEIFFGGCPPQKYYH